MSTHTPPNTQMASFSSLSPDDEGNYFTPQGDGRGDYRAQLYSIQDNGTEAGHHGVKLE